MESLLNCERFLLPYPSIFSDLVSLERLLHSFRHYYFTVH